MNVNKVILVGRLTRDPDMRTTPSGQNVATIGMATNNFWTDKSGQKQEKTEFHTVILWGRIAEVAGQYLTKGQELFVEGRLQTREYTAKDGTERRVTEIVGETIQLGARPRGHDSEYAPTASSSKPSTAQSPAPAAEPEEPEIRIEDVPF